MSEHAAADGPVLAVDTATSLGSVAVGLGEQILAEIVLGVEVRHSSALLPAVSFALERSGLQPGGIRAVVAGGGPGSFTGVRITAATAKGMVYALGIPLLCYSTLEAIAAGAMRAGEPVCALLDARRSEVYAACYRFGTARTETLLEPCALPVDEVVARLASCAPLYVGEGAIRYADRIESAGGRTSTGPTLPPRASTLLWLARREPDRGLVTDVAAWQPDYARPSNARPMS